MELTKYNDISDNDLLSIISKMDHSYTWDSKKISRYSLEENIKIINSDLNNEIIKNSNIIFRILEIYSQESTKKFPFFKKIISPNHYYAIIITLLNLGANSNLVDKDGNNFIQIILKLNYFDEFIFDIIKCAMEYGFDINHVNNNGETILHTLIYSGVYFHRNDEIERIVNLVLNSKDFNKEIEDNNKIKIIDAMEYHNSFSDSKGKYSISSINSLKKLFEEKNKNCTNTKEKNNSSSEIKISETYGELLTSEQIIINPNLDDYINELILYLASNKKNPIIKCSNLFESKLLINELIYRINNNLVPIFLKDTAILKVDINFLLFQYSDYKELKKVIDEYIKKTINKNIILLIDDINILDDKNTPKTNNILSILEPFMKNGRIKLIGITTKDTTLDTDYNIINFNSNNYNVVFNIIKNMYMYYVSINNIFFNTQEDEKFFIDTLITLEDDSILDKEEFTVNLNDIESIIDYIFCLAKVNNQENISLSDIKKNINNYKKVHTLTKK